MMNGRIVALDIGDARIGVAVSDETGTIANPVTVIHSVGWGPDTKKVLEICREYGTDTVLSGLPLNMDGSEGFAAKKIRAFCGKLEELGLQVVFQDERLTTVSAHRALIEGNMRREQRKETVDKVAATFILQQYLDTMNQQQQYETEETTMNENEELMENEGLIELIDEDGQTVTFEHLVTFDYEGATYIAVSPTDYEAESEEEVAVLFMSLEQDEEDNDIYVLVEEDELNEKLFQAFNAILAEMQEDDE